LVVARQIDYYLPCHGDTVPHNEAQRRLIQARPLRDDTAILKGTGNHTRKSSLKSMKKRFASWITRTLLPLLTQQFRLLPQLLISLHAYTTQLQIVKCDGNTQRATRRS